jgi:hypothetical protein
MTLMADLRWFLGHLDANTPTRMHRFGVWDDDERYAPPSRRPCHDGLGSPASDLMFVQWLDSGLRTRIAVADDVPCFHIGRSEGTLCEVCAVYNEEGEAIVETGTRRSVRQVYRWPMRAAMSRLDRAVVPPGRPSLSVTLFALSRASDSPLIGYLSGVQSALVWRYPVMGDDKVAIAHFSVALRRVRRVWAED